MKQIFIIGLLAFVAAVSASNSIEVPEDITCEKPLCYTPDILYPVQDQPKQYYKCIAMLWPVIRTCHDDLYFDYFKQDCVVEEEFTDVCNPEPTEEPEIPTTTEEPLEKVSCEKPRCLLGSKKRHPVRDAPKFYYECEGIFNPVMKRCPITMYFNYYKQKCVRGSEWVDACEPLTPTTEEPTTTEEITTEEPVTTEEPLEKVSCEKPRCLLGSKKRYPVRDVPNYYYECEGVFKPKMKKCPLFYFFNFYTQDCVKRNQWIDACEPLEPSTTTEEPTSTTEATSSTTEEAPSSTTEENPSPTVDYPTCRPPLCLTHTDKLFPVQNLPNMYYKCYAAFVVRRKTCQENHYFDYYLQSCVQKHQWTNVCGDFQ